MELSDVEKQVMRDFMNNYYGVLSKADYDKSGTIEKKELQSFLMQEGTDYKEAKEAVEKLFSILDKDGNGSIEFEEVLQYHPKRNKP